MKHIHEPPDLRIVATDSLQPHEQIDPSRLPALEESLRLEGILKDPPMVLPLSEKPDRYLVLDGATRTTAFQRMKIPTMLVQVVRRDIDLLKLMTWNQVFLEAEGDSLISTIAQEKSIDLKAIEAQDQLPGDFAEDCIARLVLVDGRMWWVSGRNRGMVERISILTRMLDICRELGQIERTDTEDIPELSGIYPDLAGILIVRPFQVEDVISMVETGSNIPAGLTRFIVSPRALRLNYPIDLLSSRSSLEEKHKHLKEWINIRIRDRKVRYYAESTYLFDS